MKPFLFVGNFKANPVTREEVEQYQALLLRETGEKRWQHAEAALAPSFAHLALMESLPPSFSLAAQHGFPEKNGPYTGEVTFAMLKDLGVGYVLLGHSERREYFHETNDTVAVRVDSALKFLLRPIVCIGETKEELDAGKRNEVLAAQVRSAVQGLSKMQAEKIIFAYEPRWAIGSGMTPTSKEIQEIKDTLRSLLGETSRERIRILYGGSVKDSNLEEVCLAPGMDGVLVGKESLSPYEVVKMMERAEKYYDHKQ
jgi:triosephosphate isomerase (TIM)